MISTSEHKGGFWKINNYMLELKETVRERPLYTDLQSIPKSSCQIKKQIEWEPTLISDAQYNLALAYIARVFMNSFMHIPKMGLFSGKTGVLLYLFNYAEMCNNEVIYDFSVDELITICKAYFSNVRVDYKPDLSFSEGLTGVGWAIQYLYENNLIDIDDESVFINIDNFLGNNEICNTLDYSLSKGWIGYGVYLIERINSSTLTKGAFSKEKEIIRTIALYLGNLVDYISKSQLQRNEYNIFEIHTIIPFLIKAYNSNICRALSGKVIDQYVQMLKEKYGRETPVELSLGDHSERTMFNLLLANTVMNVENVFGEKYFSPSAFDIVKNNIPYINSKFFSISDLAIISYVYNRFYQKYRIEIFSKISNNIAYDIIHELKRLEDVEGDILSRDTCSYVKGLGIVGLVLLAKTRRAEPLWGTSLLLD